MLVKWSERYWGLAPLCNPIVNWLITRANCETGSSQTISWSRNTRNKYAVLGKEEKKKRKGKHSLLTIFDIVIDCLKLIFWYWHFEIGNLVLTHFEIDIPVLTILYWHFSTPDTLKMLFWNWCFEIVIFQLMILKLMFWYWRCESDILVLTM